MATTHNGLTAADLGLGSDMGRKSMALKDSNSSKVFPAVGAPHCRDPVFGKTWTDRDRALDWVAEAAHRQTYRVASEAAPSPRRKSLVKARLRRSKQTREAASPSIKFQGPTTWIRIGKPPAWITNSSDRSAFLIGRPQLELAARR